MSSVHGWLQADAWGAPRWIWVMTLVVLPFVNEVIQRAKWTRAQSIFQAVMRALLPVFGRVPVIGDVLRALAGEQQQPPPPALPPVSVALLFAVALGSGCMLSPAGKAHVTLTTAAQIGEAADKAITAADAAFQSAQVEEATAAGSTIEARAKLAEWRAKRAKARAAMQVYYAGLVGYQVALQTAEGAQDKKFDFGAIIAGATKLGAELIAGLRGLGINIPQAGGQ